MTEPTSRLSCSISLAFPTLIGQFRVNESQGLNETLYNTLTLREASEPSQDRANMGGWHSQGDLLEWSGQEITELRGVITEALTSMVQATGQLPEVQGRPAPRGRFGLTAWANISRKNHYHRMHNHPNSAWSGVYYVTESKSQLPMDGVLEIYDPRSFTEMVDVPGAPYGQRIQIRPEAGLMVLFPSWIYHFVHPCQTDDSRISIAFNARWLPA